MKQYILRVLIAFDQLVNTLFWGYPNETLSSRAWRRGILDGNRWWRYFHFYIDWLFAWVDEHHCELSYIYCKTNLKTGGLYFPTYHPSTTVRARIITPIRHSSFDDRPSVAIDHSDIIEW
jgi:hypothetical protein